MSRFAKILTKLNIPCCRGRLAPRKWRSRILDVSENTIHSAVLLVAGAEPPPTPIQDADGPAPLDVHILRQERRSW